jgi:hypothetical protein
MGGRAWRRGAAALRPSIVAVDRRLVASSHRSARCMRLISCGVISIIHCRICRPSSSRTLARIPHSPPDHRQPPLASPHSHRRRHVQVQLHLHTTSMSVDARRGDERHADAQAWPVGRTRPGAHSIVLVLVRSCRRAARHKSRPRSKSVAARLSSAARTLSPASASRSSLAAVASAASNVVDPAVSAAANDAQESEFPPKDYKADIMKLIEEGIKKWMKFMPRLPKNREYEVRTAACGTRLGALRILRLDSPLLSFPPTACDRRVAFD